ncbi:MAG: hypothetical protein IKR51_08025, partial [Oscillospiraceae bacterium]|nr:hypothetical protein [Oscillospiraceae bacterium]
STLSPESRARAVMMPAFLRTPPRAPSRSTVCSHSAPAFLYSAAVSDPSLVAWAEKSFPGRVAVGIDALDGTVRVSGWEKDSGLDCIEFAKKMEALGVSTIIFTDISRDGMLSGPSLGALKGLSSAVSCDVVASGGVTTIDDVRALRDAGLYGAIIGKAYYAGTIDLAQAISEGGAPCSPNA